MTGFSTARELAARGFLVFPIKAGAKFPPLWSNWPNKATDQPAAGWSAETADANVGIHCAGLCVVDVDVAKGGFDSLFQLDLDFGLVETLQCNTPRGGFHLFYRLPEGHPGVPNSVEKLGKGLDIRSTGGYVVGAGSRTADGAYVWRNPDTPIAPIPDWLLSRLGTPEPKSDKAGTIVPDAGQDTLERATAWLAGRPGAVEGQGGDAFTFATAAFLRDYGLSANQAYTLLLEWNARCSPPWGLDDLWAKVENAYRYAEGEPGAKAITADDFPLIEPSAVPSISAPDAPRANRRGPVSMAVVTAVAATASAYIVKGFLQQGSYAMLYGAPGEGKTFVALDIAYNVAAGREWMGRRVKQGLVLYIGFEAYGGLANRLRALRQKYGADAGALYIAPGGFDLRTVEGRRGLGEWIAQLPEKPKLIAIDTFAYAIAGGDENSAQDVGAFNSAVQALIESTGACVLLIHHTGKDASKGARGSSALPAAIDTEISLADRTITPTKQREGELTSAFGFKLTPILIGTDDDGDPIMSCVVDSATAEERRSTPRRGTNEERVWAELVERRPNNEPIALMELQDYCAAFLPAGDTRLRQAFRDALRKLRERGLIQVDEAGMITRIMT